MARYLCQTVKVVDSKSQLLSSFENQIHKDFDVSNAQTIIKELSSIANSKKAVDLQRFFKTGPGKYAEGDIFLGVMVPQRRAIAKKYQNLSLGEIRKLTESNYHEARFCGLLILVSQIKKTKSQSSQKLLFDLYVNQFKAS